MDIIFAIRALIFFTAGLILLLFPKKVLRFQIFVVKKLRIKFDAEREYKYHPHLGVAFIIIALLLLAYSLIK